MKYKIVLEKYFYLYNQVWFFVRVAIKILKTKRNPIIE